MSNSKLTAHQKQMRKNLRKSFGASCEMVTVGRVTLFRQPEFKGSNMGLLSIAVASPNETKLRRKVGEYHALYRAANFEYIKVPMSVSLVDMGMLMDGQTTMDYDAGYTQGYQQAIENCNTAAVNAEYD